MLMKGYVLLCYFLELVTVPRASEIFWAALAITLLELYYLWVQKAWARVLRAYSSSKRERKAAT